MPSDQTKSKVHRILDEVDFDAQCSAVSQLESAEELQYCAEAYNWDDGYRIPRLIANNPQCDLGVAVELFWLAEGMDWYLGDKEIGNEDWQREHSKFCKLITDRILSGHYRVGSTSFDPGLSKVKQATYRKQGVPDILISPLKGQVTR